MPPLQTKAVTNVAKELNAEQLTALLQQAGWAEKQTGDIVPRMKLDGNMLTTPDGGMYVYNAAKPNIPACTVRIVRPPEEYWAIWVDDAAAASVDAPDIAGTFSKKYLQPDPDRKVWPSDEMFEQLKAKDNKASWKGDILLQVIPESGTLVGDETVYLLTLATTSLIDFKGTSRTPSAGSFSTDNFITKLSKFAMAEEGVTDPSTAVLNALTSLTLGGVAAEVRILRAENKELGRTWPVVVFDPIHIEPMEQGDLLTSGEDEADS